MTLKLKMSTMIARWLSISISRNSIWTTTRTR